MKTARSDASVGGSNGEWGEVAADPAASARWDAFDALDLLPTNDTALNAFAESRGLLVSDLSRIGARITTDTGHPALVFWFDGWRKYRNIVTHKRWTDPGAIFDALKIIRADGDSAGLIIAEGETDGALLTRVCPTFDVGILPAGAGTWTPRMRGQAESYGHVLVALDNDEAGDAGSDRILADLPHGQRLRPPEGVKDWCEAYVKGFLPEGWVPEPAPRRRTVFSIREVMDADMGSAAENNWLDEAVCPVGGVVMIHGPVKSMKSVLLMEMLRSLTTGTPFAGYLPFIRDTGPGRALLFQMEIPPFGFQQRMAGMLAGMEEGESNLFQENLWVYGVADKRLPRFKLTDRNGFRGDVLRAVAEAEADIVAFDPLQRLAGAISIDKPDEVAPLFELYEELQDMGKTVVFTHHDNKAMRNTGSPYSASGSQRFAADPDAICTVWHDPKCMIPDYNDGRVKQRNFSWTVRDGAPAGRSMKVWPSDFDDDFMCVSYGPPITPDSATDSQVDTQSGGAPPID